MPARYHLANGSLSAPTKGNQVKLCERGVPCRQLWSSSGGAARSPPKCTLLCGISYLTINVRLRCDLLIVRGCCRDCWEHNWSECQVPKRSKTFLMSAALFKRSVSMSGSYWTTISTSGFSIGCRRVWEARNTHKKKNYVQKGKVNTWNHKKKIIKEVKDQTWCWSSFCGFFLVPGEVLEKNMFKNLC